jgi:hypothetical protein
MNGRYGWVAACLVLPGTLLGADATRDAQPLAERIDKHLRERFAAAKVEPAPLADDAEFLRRVTLDLIGRIPTVPEVRTFLDDPSPDKRRRLVDRLLASPGYVNHFTNVWRNLLVPEAATNPQLRMAVPAFDAWLRNQLANDAGHDAFVRDLLAAPLSAGNRRMPMNPYDGEPSPLTYYMAKEFKPENLAGSTARLFMGVRIECAQCHDHPNASWKREQFWGFAALFASLARPEQAGILGPVREMNDKLELPIPGKEQVVQATFLDGKQPEPEFRVPPRAKLARWMTTAENPYFARAAVNRYWAHFFGIGLVEPVDDLHPDNAPSHPELFDELAREFAGSGFDVKFLIRALTATQAYQLSSTQTHAGQEDPRLFARMAVKGLTTEQIFDSFVQATGFRDLAQQSGRGMPSGARADFQARFSSGSDSRTEAQTSILQALYLMNGSFVANATSLARSDLLTAVAESPFLDTTGRIETLFLAALGRRPRPDEMQRLAAYVEGGGPRKETKAALGDVFWALLNSPEFILNH